MHRLPQVAWLCGVIDNSLSSLTEQESQLCPLTKENERHILITLSQIARRIRESHNEHDTQSDPPHQTSEHLPPVEEDCHDCFAHIISHLVIFLNVESQYVRHSTSNILADIHIYAKLGSTWEEYLRLLCVCMEISIYKILSSTSNSLIAGANGLESDSSSFIIDLCTKMVNANWYTVASLVRVLRIILKYLKQCPGSELAETYMICINCSLSSIPWELLDGVLVVQDIKSQINSSKYLVGNNGLPVSGLVFQGALLQLFCSLVQQSSSIEVGTTSEHPILGRISNLLPKLLNWCFQKHKDGNWTCGSHYTKHKLLMLMIRLSFKVHQEHSMLILWLQLLQEHFQDVLLQPLSKCDSALDDCPEGSPFLSSVSDGQKDTRHLQRQAVFLFLKCCFGLINSGKEIDSKCSCTTAASCLTYEVQSGQECCIWKKGLLELSEWLNKQVHLTTIVDYESYLEKCVWFASSFIQLYIDEDNYLFEVLLHISASPFPSRQMNYKGKDVAFQELKGDIIFHLSNIFNPVHLFHLFLAELHYDHSVLLDYLISEDSGTHCLQYLLRSLRTIGNSWSCFLEFPVCGDIRILSSCKKRKLPVCDSDSNREVDLISAKRKGRSFLELLDHKSETNDNFDSMLDDTRRRNYQNAKECLFSLKSSVENLHQKNLFPYNPQALLRSFMRFQELCHQQESLYLQKTGKMIL